MSDPFIGEIRLWVTNFAPLDWAYCDGQPLSVQQYEALSAVIGTSFGGSGNTFNLPDLRGRAPVHLGGDLPAIGSMTGADTHTLNGPEMPAHSHHIMASSADATDSSPEGKMLAKTQSSIPDMFSSSTPNRFLSSGVLGAGGGNQAHSNIQPSLGLSFCIALYGIFPVKP